MLAGCVSGPCFTSVRTSDEASQVEDRIRAVCDAVEQKDLDRLDGYHAYGSRFSKFDSSSAGRIGSDAARAAEHAGIIRAQDLSVRTDDVRIDVLGKNALVTCILESRFRSGDEFLQHRYRATFVMLKEHGEWLIVHEHLSPIVE